MDITAFAPPPTPGTSTPGDLYADLQSRTLWLAVDVAVDPSQFVLISDIEAMLASDVSTLASAKSYTDTKVAPLAPIANPVFTGNPRAPTPVTTDNDTSIATTAYVKAAIAADPDISGIVKGMIVLYSGALSSIGVGTLAGWALCDGRAAASLPGGVTPNLKDRFIIGAGNLNPGDKNSAVANFNVSAEGAHTHTLGATTLTLAQIPSHSHGAGTYAFSDTSSSAGAHTHDVRTYASDGNNSSRAVAVNDDIQTTFTVAGAALSAGNHTHTVSGAVTGSSSASGSGASHTHTLGNANDHVHLVLASQVRAAILWYALAYIVKL